MKEAIAKEYVALIPNLFSSFSELNQGVVQLSHIQNHVVEYLFMQQKALNLKDISAGLNIAKQQLKNVIKELEADEFVIKEPDPYDKRAVLVSLTAKGNEVQEKKWADIYEKLSGNITKLDEEEQIDLHYALHKVNVLLKKMEERP
ncbi:MarR family winged helix-turn-helix transcriptional regulator [Falsibacillus albus]|uniref:MarR family transcriptional regulator n=1 Tax=Falsibacillus albus TaxID=2478915 RepID=A0A3L7JWL4_9BACI|nr:MarR family winged helix-turn-helix transcriptional regulator [Falsibacillus albus]RLQ94644.1 MarR family transcriptional regulator [Falsibacillus albus]